MYVHMYIYVASYALNYTTLHALSADIQVNRHALDICDSSHFPLRPLASYPLGYPRIIFDDFTHVRTHVSNGLSTSWDVDLRVPKGHSTMA